MSTTLVYQLLTCFLLVTLTVGMWRVLRGPTAADRMLAAQLFGTTAVAILLIFAQMTNNSSLRNVALLLALFTVSSGHRGGFHTQGMAVSKR
jgi:multicomponent Na+:H+ antiporter subunit F